MIRSGSKGAGRTAIDCISAHARVLDAIRSLPRLVIPLDQMPCCEQSADPGFDAASEVKLATLLHPSKAATHCRMVLIPMTSYPIPASRRLLSSLDAMVLSSISSACKRIYAESLRFSPCRSSRPFVAEAGRIVYNVQ
jgi:hypothetical protein